jgi:hypothetical protein
MAIVVGLRALQSDGSTLILDMAGAGYEIVNLTLADRTWRRATTTSPDVEGDIELQSVLESGVYEIELRVVGLTTASCITRRTSLMNAVETRSWVLEVTIDGAMTKWKANRADSTTSQERMMLHNHIRPMVIRVPVQPTPV